MQLPATAVGAVAGQTDLRREAAALRFPPALLTLLHLGTKNIRLGPTLPAFVTPNVLNVLVEKFNLMPIKTVEEDLGAILKVAA